MIHLVAVLAAVETTRLRDQTILGLVCFAAGYVVARIQARYTDRRHP